MSLNPAAALSPNKYIKFSNAAPRAREFEYVAQSMRGGHLHGDGPFTRYCATFLERELGCERVLLTTSCTHALELAGLLLDLAPGDQVIVPSFTFVSTATALQRAGAEIVFVDVRSDTLNMDEEQVAQAITPRTRAIVPVHYAGVACEMAELTRLSTEHGLTIIEDAAHALFGRYDGQCLGTFGALGCLSFHSTKNFTCGEGGALLINDPALVDRAEVIREKGTNRRAFAEGRVEKYTWVDIGSSYLPSDVLSAMLLAQFEDHAEIQSQRRTIWTTYHESLRDLAASHGIRLPTVPQRCDQAYHLFYIIVRSLSERSDLLKFLRGRGIEATFHYQPLHASDAGRKFASSFGDCPRTKDISERIVRLPLHLDLDRADQQRVIEALFDFYRMRD